MRPIKLLFVIVSLIVSNASIGANLHLIAIFQTSDSNIGATVDYKNVPKAFKEYAKEAGLNYKEHVFRKNALTSSSLSSFIRNLNVGFQDVIIFIYSGHGASISSSGKYPSFVIGNMNFTEMSVFNHLKQKKARFTLVVYDACNKALSSSRSIYASSRSPRLKTSMYKLFKYAKGTIIASSSKQGQFSYGDNQVGGYYCNSLLQAIDFYAQRSDCSWSKILSKAKQMTTSMASSRNRTQVPQYDANVSYKTPSASPTPEEEEGDENF